MMHVVLCSLQSPSQYRVFVNFAKALGNVETKPRFYFTFFSFTFQLLKVCLTFATDPPPSTGFTHYFTYKCTHLRNSNEAAAPTYCPPPSNHFESAEELEFSVFRLAAYLVGTRVHSAANVLSLSP